MKEFFQAVWDAEGRIRRLKRRKARFEDMARSLGANLSGMPSNHNRTSKVEYAACELVQLQTDLENELCEQIHLITLAKQIIQRIPAAKHRQVLELRYIDGMAWTDITKEMGYQDDRSVYKVHGAALVSAQKCAGGIEYHNNHMV